MKNSLIITLLLCLLTGISYAQVIKIKEGINVLGMNVSNAKSWIKSKGYIVEPSGVSDELNFRKLTSLGDQALSIAFKDNKVSSISWQEHIMYASLIMGDVQLAGFEMGEVKSTKFFPFKNKEKNLLLSLISKEEVNQVFIVIGSMNKTQIVKESKQVNLKKNTNFSILNSMKSVTELYEFYGDKNILKIIDNEMDDSSFQSFVLYPDTIDEVVICTKGKKITRFDFGDVQLRLGLKNTLTGWKFPISIRIGMSIESVVGLNQKNFDIYGFEWDDGGEVVSWKGGKLSTSKISLKFSSGDNVDQKRYQKVMGEQVFNTAQNELKGLGLKVSKIHVIK